MSNKTVTLCATQALGIIVVMLLASVPAKAQIQFDKPKTEKPLPNPSILAAARDEVLTLTKQLLETREIPLDKEDCNPNTGECTLISKPVVFIKGITTRSQLEHYCEVPAATVRNWVRGRYTLRFHLNPASPKSSQVGVYARFEGMTDGLIGNDWVPLTSNGTLEDELLKCIQARLIGEVCDSESRR